MKNPLTWVLGQLRQTTRMQKAVIFTGSAVFGLACLILIALFLPVNSAGQSPADVIRDTVAEQSGVGSATTTSPAATPGPANGGEQRSPQPTTAPSSGPVVPSATASPQPTARATTMPEPTVDEAVQPPVPTEPSVVVPTLPPIDPPVEEPPLPPVLEGDPLEPLQDAVDPLIDVIDPTTPEATP